jgi:histidine ammonia-lyase
MQNIVIGERALSLAEILLVAHGRAQLQLNDSISFCRQLEKSQKQLQICMDKQGPVYGVTTGFGGNCGSRTDAEEAIELGQNLLRFHGCGTGSPLGLVECRAAMVCRLLSLVQGCSGVSRALLEQLVAFINLGITPVVPEQGSVGASGDLTPLSYVGAALAGEREVFFEGKRMPSSQALKETNLPAYALSAKEALSIMNGTSVMTGIAIVAVEKCTNILEAAIIGSALAVHALAGHVQHFDPSIFQLKPFLEQAAVAQKLRDILKHISPPPESEAAEDLQDPYSLRCAPHVLGVLADAMRWIENWIEIEANAVSDNPIFEPTTNRLLTNGNFYGGHVAFAMDGLKSALASVADLSDRQVARLVDRRYSRGLPDRLTKVVGERQKLHHGFKGIQITCSALAAEASKNSMPASVFSRSTEAHNQDKVSLGTIAARDANAMCDLVSKVVAIELMTAAQACEIRGQLDTRPKLKEVILAIRHIVSDTVEDRSMDQDIERLSKIISQTFNWNLT